jgi:hypothetical protein
MTSEQGGAPDGNTNSLKHGGAKARKDLTTGAEFAGPAAIAEANVKAELANSGRVSLVERGATRLQAAADLYWGALSQLAEQTPQPDARLVKVAEAVGKQLREQGQNELAKALKDAVAVSSQAGIAKQIESYTKTFGWLQSKALSAWAQLKQEQLEAPNALDYEHILSQPDDS